jgi:hypothetical protein
MSKAKIKEIYHLTLETEQTMLRFAQSKSNKTKTWFERTDLSGLCRKASKRLSKRLNQIGLNAHIIQGEFDIPKAGGNGLNRRLPHYWVEVKIENQKILADPTCRQFSKYLPVTKLVNRDFISPFVGKLGSKQSKAYIYGA